MGRNFKIVREDVISAGDTPETRKHLLGLREGLIRILKDSPGAASP